MSSHENCFDAVGLTANRYTVSSAAAYPPVSKVNAAVLALDWADAAMQLQTLMLVHEMPGT